LVVHDAGRFCGANPEMPLALKQAVNDDRGTKAPLAAVRTQVGGPGKNAPGTRQQPFEWLAARRDRGERL
jgi:hypothetical protein